MRTTRIGAERLRCPCSPRARPRRPRRKTSDGQRRGAGRRARRPDRRRRRTDRRHHRRRRPGCFRGRPRRAQHGSRRPDAHDHALDQSDDGESTTWRNEDTGTRYSITPTRTYEGKSGGRCRESQPWCRSTPRRDRPWHRVPAAGRHVEDALMARTVCGPMMRGLLVALIRPSSRAAPPRRGTRTGTRGRASIEAPSRSTIRSTGTWRSPSPRATSR